MKKIRRDNCYVDMEERVWNTLRSFYDLNASSPGAAQFTPPNVVAICIRDNGTPIICIDQ